MKQIEFVSVALNKAPKCASISFQFDIKPFFESIMVNSCSFISDLPNSIVKVIE